MDTSAIAVDFGAALFGKARRAVLGLFFQNPDEMFYLRQAARIANVGLGPIQRELARLTAAGILTRFERGHQVWYQANKEGPLFAELRALAVKALGAVATIHPERWDSGKKKKLPRK